jgi:hypothetical protein
MRKPLQPVELIQLLLAALVIQLRPTGEQGLYAVEVLDYITLTELIMHISIVIDP